MEDRNAPLAEPLLPTTSSKRRFGQRPLLAAFLLFCSAIVLLWSRRQAPSVAPVHLSATEAKSFMHGTSLGGWLLMEINPAQKLSTSGPDVRPSWMFDQIFAASELDFVTTLQKDSGDEYTIQTMRNHWEGYITEDMLDQAHSFGVDAVRIPVGYWIVDKPVGGSSYLEYGFSPEGFVTGGLNYLQALLPKLAKRNIVALIDVHALPCNSACVSDGIDCANPLAFTPGAPVANILRCTGACTCGGEDCPLVVGEDRVCDGKVYVTEREGGTTWMDVGLESVSKLAGWVASLSDADKQVIAGFQLANEPALNSAGYDEAVKAYYKAALQRAREHLPPSMPLVMSFIPPNDYAVPAFVNKLKEEGGGSLLIDHHW